jgi:hypothetical protein
MLLRHDLQRADDEDGDDDREDECDFHACFLPGLL